MKIAEFRFVVSRCFRGLSKADVGAWALVCFYQRVEGRSIECTDSELLRIGIKDPTSVERLVAQGFLQYEEGKEGKAVYSEEVAQYRDYIPSRRQKQLTHGSYKR